jgi:hypothetical protein
VTQPAAPRRFSIAVSILIALTAFCASLQAAVSLPLEGYCKPGRYFPILVDGPDTAASIDFAADGCVSSSTSPSATGQIVVPMLVTGNPRLLHWPGGSIPLRSLREDERLIAGVTDQLDTAEAVFPGKRLLPIHLDSAQFLPGPPAAWETLDGIVLDAAFMSRLTDSQRSALLSGGVKLICPGDSPPDTRWPWRKVDAAWVLAWPPAGPIGQVIDPNAYAPTFAWTPGLSTALRAQVIGAGVLLMLLILALMLRPNRITFTASVALCVVSTAAIIGWRNSLGSVDRAGGDIVISSSGLLQRDAYVYHRATETASQTVQWTGWTHPLLASPSSLRDLDLRLLVSSDNGLSFSCRAIAGRTMAFVRREVQPGLLPALSPGIDSPMIEAVKAAYLVPGDRIVGTISGGQQRWNTVVIERK